MEHLSADQVISGLDERREGRAGRRREKNPNSGFKPFFGTK
jgi:hypothetical protein